MSIVSAVTLQVSVSEDMALIDEINAWLALRNFGPLASLEDLYGGNKRPQVFVAGAGYNHFPEDEFAEFVTGLPWRTPECVVLLVNPEEGRTKVSRAGTA